MRTPVQQKQYEAVRERRACELSKIGKYNWDKIKKSSPGWLLKYYDQVDAFLNDPSIAVVDGDQELPECPNFEVKDEFSNGYQNGWRRCEFEIQDRVKVISKEAL